MARTVEFSIDMTVDIDGETIVVEGNQDQVLIDLPSFRAARRILRHSHNILQSASKQIRTVSSMTGDFKILTRIRGRTIASSGSGINSNWSAKFLDLRSTQLHPIQILFSMLREFRI